MSSNASHSRATPRKKPRQRRSQATWEAILDAAAQVFGQQGYAATTNTVAERAGVSIGSLYQYFPNKDALLMALAERHISEAGLVLQETFAGLLRDEPDLPETLQRLIHTTVALHEQDPAMHRLLFDQTPRTPDAVARFRQLESLLAAAVAQQLVRLGVGGPHPQARALLLVQGLEAQIHGAVLAPPEGVGREALVGEVQALWLKALS
ncbi:TetR/AcrR family transcriptional regulator [Alcanivorax sp. JB21]|uniref:TetR/AcrR family transcriptional regulator n=1 Tax=Alcanivorax limicola TaxID=2874102 RepID=UPI001CBDFF0B|nr:TetR/AcrR family transcriptional regulator [Alcanivorax limicola]MBZ2188480.1 TetR/AcrR family transcriptional regulator [Alcanivorax limicola]